MAQNIIAIMLDASSKGVKKAMDEVDKSVKQTQKGITDFVKAHKIAFLAVGAAVAAATAIMIKGVKAAIIYGVEIDKMAKTTGLTTQAVAKLRFAMEQEHASFTAMSTVVPKLARAMSDSVDGIKTYKDAFEKIGIEVQDANGNLRDSEEVLLDIADFMRSGASDTEKMATSQILLGRAGKELIPFLKLGREELKILGDEAERLGLVLSDKDVKAMKKLDDALVSLKGGFRGVFNAIAVEVAPALTNIVNTIIENLPSIRDDLVNLTKGMLAFVMPLVKIAEITSQAIFNVKEWAQLWAKVAGFFLTEMPNIVEGLLKMAFGALDSLIHQIDLFLKWPMERLKALGNPILAWALKLAARVLDTFMSKGRELFNKLPAGFQEVINRTESQMRGWANDLENESEALQEKLGTQWTKDAPETFGEGLDIMKDLVTDFSATVDDAVTETARDNANSIHKSLAGLQQTVGQVMEALETGTKETAARQKTEIRSFTQFATDTYGEMGLVVNSIMGGIESSLSGALSGMLSGTQTFKEAFTGLWKGIKSAIIGAIAEMIAKWIIWKTVTSVFGFGGTFSKFLGLESGGMVPSMASGGPVPIIAHAGEFVIPADMVNDIRRTKAIPGELLASVVQGRSPRGGAFQQGGRVGAGTGISAVDIGGIAITVNAVPGENVDALLDRIGDQIERRTASAIQFAQRTTNIGVARAEEAV